MIPKVTSIGRVGPKAAKLTREKWKMPSVIEIVCEPTGRRLVAVTDRPDYRKSVYFFHLKNIMVYSPANIFFGSKMAVEDVEKHGIDSFYFEIVKTMPDDSSVQDLEKARASYMKKFKPEQLYNRRKEKQGYARSIFADIDPEMAKMEEKRVELRDKLMKVEERYNKVRQQCRLEAINVRHEKGNSYVQARKLKEISKKWRPIQDERSDLEYELKIHIEKLRTLHKKLIKKYSANATSDLAGK